MLLFGACLTRLPVIAIMAEKAKAENEISTLQSGTQRVGGRCEPDVSAGAEWTREPQTERQSLEPCRF